MGTRHEALRKLGFALADINNAQGLVSQIGMVYQEQHPEVSSVAELVIVVLEEGKKAVTRLQETIG